MNKGMMTRALLSFHGVLEAEHKEASVLNNVRKENGGARLPHHKNEHGQVHADRS